RGLHREARWRPSRRPGLRQLRVRRGSLVQEIPASRRGRLRGHDPESTPRVHRRVDREQVALSHGDKPMTAAEVLIALDRAIAAATPGERPGLVVALAARLAQLGAGLTSPTPAPALEDLVRLTEGWADANGGRGRL